MEYVDYRLLRSRRKTISMEIDKDGVLVRAPFFASVSEIDAFVLSHREWIERQIKKRDERERKVEADRRAGLLLSRDEINELADRAMTVIPERVRYYAPLIGVTYGRITIRNQRSRWGSCSSKGNLNFNCLLMLAPPEVLDAVIVHELCHRKHMDHSEAFYAEVLRVMPSYKKWDTWLKLHGPALMRRMTG